MLFYERFEDVQQNIKDQTPPIIYKYRNWEDSYHKKIITDKEIWFAHPASLNDPYDVRPPHNYIIGDIDWAIVKNNLKAYGRLIEPDLSDEELEFEVQERLESMMNDPIEYYKRSHQLYNAKSSNHDHIGVFSCCSTYDNEPMWAHYGNNHCGFAIGFNTVELAQTLKNCVVGFVDYNNSPSNYYIMGDNRNLYLKDLFQKSTKWSPEQEVRFAAVGIGSINKRAEIFPENAVEEIVFGLNTSDEVQEGIIKNATHNLPKVQFFKLKTNVESFGLSKIKL